MDFVRDHWKAYLAGLIVAVVLGFAAAVFVGVKGSTPAAVRAIRVSDEAAQDTLNQQIANAAYGSGETGETQTGGTGENGEGDEASYVPEEESNGEDAGAVDEEGTEISAE